MNVIEGLYEKIGFRKFGGWARDNTIVYPYFNPFFYCCIPERSVILHRKVYLGYHYFKRIPPLPLKMTLNTSSVLITSVRATVALKQP